MGETRKVRSWQGYAYLWGPVLTFLVVALLALVLRWAYPGRRTSLVSRRARPGPATDYGLLVTVAAPASEEEAAWCVRRLTNGGIQATVAHTVEGRRIMVWPDDERRARKLLGPPPPPPRTPRPPR
jgi:hypothetical protein